MQRIVLAANAEADQPWVVDAAAQLAEQTGAEVAVLSVDELETEMLSTLPRDEFLKRAERAASDAYERLQAAGVTATREVRSGRALENILDFAEEQHADLIVVGSSTRGPLASRLLGSVPVALIQRAHRPVLVVTNPDHSQAAGG
jgi:nucleotide-binding universal stress UspA family protein